MTIASMVKGDSALTARKAARSAEMWSVRAVDRRSASVTVKKYEPPGMYCR